MKKTILLTGLLFCIGLAFASAQTTYNKSDFKDKPVWIEMMNDPNVNYYDAVEAYETYFKSHPLPGEQEEEELMGSTPEARAKFEKEMKRENKKIKTDKQRAELVEREQMTYQSKRFRNWMNEVKPFVQENGHILTMEERAELWKKQQAEKK